MIINFGQRIYFKIRNRSMTISSDACVLQGSALVLLIKMLGGFGSEIKDDNLTSMYFFPLKRET